MSHVEIQLPFQRQRERELWSLLLEAQPSLQAHAERADRALRAGVSPLAILTDEVQPQAYASVVRGWRSHPPQPLRWEAFEVEGEAGRGAHGVVYWARWRGQRVALKLLHDLEDPRRFLREAALLERLEHPNLVRLLARGEAEGCPYLATEAMLGGSLADAGAQLPAQAVAWAIELAAGLAYAHAEGVIHRDLKPSNVLLGDGRPRLVDFGLARSLKGTSLTGTRNLLGSVEYAAPEQLSDARRAGPPADVFGLGALLHFLLTGSPPWPDARTLGQRVQRIQAGFTALPGPLDLGHAPRRTLEALLALTLAADPAQRLGLTELHAALSDCHARL
jgi:serine/threonine-protein kinase